MAKGPSQRRAGLPGGWAKATDLAFAICIGAVLARGMMLETIRDALGVFPGQETVLRAPLAGTTVTMDLLMYLPALVIGLRCMFDRGYAARRSWSVILLAALGALALASMSWSADRFGAAVSATKLLAGAAVLWSTIQWVRDWGRLRIVCALLVGMLAVNLIHGIIYTYADIPETRDNWAKNGETILKGQGIEPGSFAAKQFERKVLSGELMGFCASPNSLAAITSMAMVLLVSMLVQQRRDGQSAGWSIVPVMLLLGGIWVIWRAQSKAAAATPVIGLGLIVAGWKLRAWLAKHRGVAFAAGCAAFFGMWAAIIAHGLHYGTLFQRTLTFRWHYWIASLAMFREHLLSGVGWENFGQYYTQYRLPVAPEEIHDPHNLLVRFATELGIAGLLLAIGWLGAIFWEGTSPQSEPQAAESLSSKEPVQLRWLLTAICAAVVLAVASGVDMTLPSEIILLEAMYRIGYGLILLVLCVLLTTTDLGQIRLRQAPAPFVLVGLVAAVAVFLIHNMIDFAFSETGPFYLFMVTLGVLLGMREALHPGKSGRAALACAGWIAGALVTAVVVGVPVMISEAAARTADGDVARGRTLDAANLYAQAYSDSAWLRNSAYLQRQAEAQTWAHQSPVEVSKTLDGAIAANPRSEKAILQRAQAEAALGNAAAAVTDFERAAQLDPRDVELRIDAGEAMERLGLRSQAISAYEVALANDDRLPADEIKRLAPARVDGLRRRIQLLQAASSGK